MAALGSKIWLPALGKPVLEWTLGRFRPQMGWKGIVVIRSKDRARVEPLLARPGFFPWDMVIGGRERFESVGAGLSAIRTAGGTDGDFVLIHDGARPLVSAGVIERVVQALSFHAAVIPVIPVADTLKRVRADGTVEQTVPRDALYLAQTPQGFHLGILDRAYRTAPSGLRLTDDASYAEHCGNPVHTVAGDVRNRKLTMPDDLEWLYGELEQEVRGANRTRD